MTADEKYVRNNATTMSTNGSLSQSCLAVAAVQPSLLLYAKLSQKDANFQTGGSLPSG